MPIGGRMDSRAEGFRERLLGGEALGQIVCRQAMGGEALQLRIDEDAVGEALAPARKRLLDAADLHDIRPHSENHLAASTMRRFISRTASRIPTNSARLTMAWPICSSRSPASPATGATLK